MITTLLATISLATAPQPGIMWFSDLKQGLAAAAQTNKPILLMSAAPQCAEVPGDW